MRVLLDGAPRDLQAGLTVAALLAQEGEPEGHVLVEVNGEYVPRDQYPTRTLAEGDRVEIILPAFGG